MNTLKDCTFVATGTAVGLNALTNFEFDPGKPYTCCRICGKVFQHSLDRAITPDTPVHVQFERMEVRRRWSKRHAMIHSAREHKALALSGHFCTPEAAQILAAYGIISLTDMVMSKEHEHAYATAPSTPVEDAEGSGA